MYIAGSGTPYWYEWEVGLIECLKMMLDTTIDSVVLQSTSFQSLDDVVVHYTDGSIINIQVKHSDTGDNFTYSTLSSGSPSMLEKWAKEWQREKDNYKIKEIRIVTNRKWGPAESESKCSFEHFVSKVLPLLHADYNYQCQDDSEASAVDWFKSHVSFLKNDAFDFVKVLNFHKEEGLHDVELKIRELVQQILGTDKKEAVDASTNGLLAKLSIWATSRRSKQEIFREDIYNALCTSTSVLPNYELYPEKPIFPSRESFAKLFVSKLQSSEKKIFFLQGLPGAGKTNFVSYLAQLEDSIVDFRFYTYLPVNREHPSFSDDEGYYTGELLWCSILVQLKKYFEEHNLLYKFRFPLVYEYLSITEMRDKVLEYLPMYAKAIGRTCYVFIDGLDHAARSGDARNSFLSQLPLPDEIGEGVKFVLVGQPINDKYPHALIKNSQVKYINLPTLEEPDIIMLLSNENINVPSVDIMSLAKSIISIVGNNALNVLFAIYEVKKMQAEYTFDSIIACLQEKKLNCQIDRYYDWIVSSIEESALLLKIKLIFAFASRKIPAKHIADICGVQLEDVAIILNKLYPLIVCDFEEYYTFHNDVRLFFKESMITNSNFNALSLAIYDKVVRDEHLGQYKYDILFGLTLELSDKQVLFDLFSPEYIINSVQYKVPVDRLVQQFYTVTQVVSASGQLNNIDKISFLASTISQYINNIKYNEKEDLLYESEIVSSKTESEKYILSTKDNINDIVYDVYSLLKKQLLLRAEKVFEEYLKTVTLSEYLNSDQSESDLGFCERSGYICRFFNSDILNQEAKGKASKYAMFVKGWLDASSEFIDAAGIEKTFSLKSYRAEYLNEYTSIICNDKDLGVDAFNLLSEIYVSDNCIPIFSVVELCVKGILSKYATEELQKVIMERQEEILTEQGFKYDADRILCYIKSNFCIFSRIESKDAVPQLYLDILNNNHISLGKRGYDPAICQFNLSKTISEDFFNENKDIQNQIKTIYETVFIVRKFGSGSCFDCNAYAVRTFLLKLLFFTFENQYDNARLIEICEGIKDLFTWENAMYVSELTDLFYIANAKEEYLNIAEHWCGADGILWDDSYADVEYIGNNVVQMLTKFGMLEDAQIIKKRISFKLFGYVDHKDYSLNGLLECYNLLPLTEEKLLNLGMKLLTVSDKASLIGDNRMAGEINDAVFETAASLGVDYIAALFELKNNPKEFYNWRNCFLDAYYKRVSLEEWSDTELVALYSLVNAWINDDIESKERHGDNRSEHLCHYNYKIIELIKDEQTRKKLSLLGKCSPMVEHNKEGYVIKSSEQYKEIIDEIKEKGYGEGIEQKITTTFSDVYGGQAKMLIDIGDIIDVSENNEFISNCVVEFIVRRRKYGYRGSGLRQLIETYYSYFSNADWMRLFNNIISSISSANMDDFYSVNEDIETLCLYYSYGTMPEKLSDLCSQKLNVHCDWLTSCGLTKINTHELKIESSMNSLNAFASYQLGDNFI